MCSYLTCYTCYVGIWWRWWVLLELAIFFLWCKNRSWVLVHLCTFSFFLNWYLLHASLKQLEWILFLVWSVLLAWLCCWKWTNHGSLVSKLLVFYMLLKFGFYVVTILSIYFGLVTCIWINYICWQLSIIIQCYSFHFLCQWIFICNIHFNNLIN